jgi:hypothetical protein
MTNEERIELLKAVAECAPKEMGARFWYVGPIMRASASTGDCMPNVVNFCGPGMDDGDGPPQLGLQDDLCDASACFAMLDAMEKAGFNTANSFDQVQTPPVHDCTAYKWPTPDDRQYHKSIGTTRAEAVARAFVQVFGKVE